MAGRRRVGVRGMMKKHDMQKRKAAVGTELAEVELGHMTKQLEVFKDNLEKFAAKHKKKINKDPAFRRDFQRMCQRIGVDPLASNKGFWSDILGVGDFYYELGVEVIEVCLQARSRTGGLMDLQELHGKVLHRRGKRVEEVSPDDIEGAIKKLKVLGSGFRVHIVGKRRIVQSVPTELNLDHSKVLSTAEVKGFTSGKEVMEAQHWDEQRTQTALEQMVKEGMAWIDDQAEDGERRYWFAGLMSQGP